MPETPLASCKILKEQHENWVDVQVGVSVGVVCWNIDSILTKVSLNQLNEDGTSLMWSCMLSSFCFVLCI